MLDYSKYPARMLEEQCIDMIIKKELRNYDFGNNTKPDYDIIDMYIKERLGSDKAMPIICYSEITKLCKRLNIPHLIDKFLVRYKLMISDDLRDDYEEDAGDYDYLMNDCIKCGRKILFEEHNYYHVLIKCNKCSGYKIKQYSTVDISQIESKYERCKFKRGREICDGDNTIIVAPYDHTINYGKSGSRITFPKSLRRYLYYDDDDPRRKLITKGLRIAKSDHIYYKCKYNFECGKKDDVEEYEKKVFEVYKDYQRKNYEKVLDKLVEIGDDPNIFYSDSDSDSDYY